MIPLTPEQVTTLKANATMASEQLKEIEMNQTLTDTCTMVNEVQGSCKKLARLNKLENLAQNDTQLAAFQAKKNLTDAQMTQLKDFVSSPKLFAHVSISLVLMNEADREYRLPRRVTT